MPLQDLLIAGDLLHNPDLPPERGWLRIAGGTITERGFGEAPSVNEPTALGGRGRLVSPAFVDAHIHLPQVDSVGCEGMQLLEWLDRVIFPAEAWWGRGQHLAMTRTSARRMIEQGTAGFAGYLTSHAETSGAALRWLASNTPLRFVAGRVAMDRNASDELIAEDIGRMTMSPTPSPLLAALEDELRHRVSANPRFAVSCTEELLAEIGWKMRDDPRLFMQTHLAESPDELRTIAALFPDEPDYTSVYEKAGLLGERSIFAHCCHLSEREWGAIADSKSVIAHCPTANIFLEAGLFDLETATERGCRVALGSDVAAGADVAMPRVARAMIETVKVRRMTGVAPHARVPTPQQAWAMMTRGGALALDWQDMGTLDVGGAATMLVIDVPDAWRDEHVLGRLLYNWDHRLIEHRVFDGVRTDPGTI